MAIFTIETDNNITAYPAPTDVPTVEGNAAISFDSQPAFVKATADWPLHRLAEVWNSIPGHISVKKFKDRKTAVARIWTAIQPLAGTPNKDAEPTCGLVMPKKRTKAKHARKPTRDAGERANKKAEVVALMKRAKGATLAEIMEHTGWQAHSVRGFISILGSKGGYTVASSKNESGERTYRIG